MQSAIREIEFGQGSPNQTGIKKSLRQLQHRAIKKTMIFRIEKDILNPITDYIHVGRDEKYFKI